MRISCYLAPLFGVAIEFGFKGEYASAQSLDQGLTRLKSPSTIERLQGEVEILQQGPDALPQLVRELDSESRSYRFTAERIFSSLLDGVLSDLDTEYAALTLDRTELANLKDRKEFAGQRQALEVRLEEWKARDPGILERLEQLLELERLETREKRARNGEATPLSDEGNKELKRLRNLIAEWRHSNPGFEEELGPFLRSARLESLGAEGGKLSDLEELRLKELEERIAHRSPRLSDLENRLVALGFPAFNRLLARATTVRQRAAQHHRELVAKFLESRRADLVPGDERLELVRYHRALLWAWEADQGGPLKERADAALSKHLKQTVSDLRAPEPIVRVRAADELYMLGERGQTALGLEAPGSEPFLRNLLRYRIHPRTYAKTGIDLQEYPRLTFREKRRRLFEYVQAAEEDALPTLRAIVMDDALEPSFNVKLAAAKALAGLRDMSGYNFLIVKHPDLTLKKPEVSREVLVIQGLEHIRDKDYQQAVEDFQKILDEAPFDFRANYHIAFAYLLVKNYTKAIHHFEIARRINPQDELTLYNLACAYALAGGKTTEAIEALEASVKAGFNDYQHVEKDPDLDSIRADERYLRLIERLKQK